MDPFLSITLLGLLVIGAYIVARVVLRLAARIVFLILIVIAGLGILYLLLNGVP